MVRFGAEEWKRSLERWSDGAVERWCGGAVARMSR